MTLGTATASKATTRGRPTWYHRGWEGEASDATRGRAVMVVVPTAKSKAKVQLGSCYEPEFFAGLWKHRQGPHIAVQQRCIIDIGGVPRGSTIQPHGVLDDLGRKLSRA